MILKKKINKKNMGRPKKENAYENAIERSKNPLNVLSVNVVNMYQKQD